MPTIHQLIKRQSRINRDGALIKRLDPAHKYSKAMMILARQIYEQTPSNGHKILTQLQPLFQKSDSLSPILDTALLSTAGKLADEQRHINHLGILITEGSDVSPVEFNGVNNAGMIFTRLSLIIAARDHEVGLKSVLIHEWVHAAVEITKDYFQLNTINYGAISSEVRAITKETLKDNLNDTQQQFVCQLLNGVIDDYPHESHL